MSNTLIRWIWWVVVGVWASDIECLSPTFSGNKLFYTMTKYFYAFNICENSIFLGGLLNNIYTVSFQTLAGLVPDLQGVPKKMWFKPIFEFLTLGGVFLWVKNNSKNFGNKKNIRLLSKILSKLTLFIRKMQKFWCFYELIAMSRMEKRI